MSDNTDGKYIVVKNGQRASEAMEEQQANAEAARQRQLLESQGQKDVKVEVKRNLYG
jgi:hypothetical protein